MLPFEIHYHDGSAKFYMKDNRGVFQSLSPDETKRQLKLYGIDGTKQQGSIMSEVERVMAVTVRESSCEYAGPLAGHTVGLEMFKNNRILVTFNPMIIEGVAKPFPMIQQILEELFMAGTTDQLHYFFGWLHMSRLMMNAG